MPSGTERWLVMLCPATVVATNIVVRQIAVLLAVLTHGGANTWGFIRGTPGLESTKANLMKRKKEGQKKVKSHWVFMLINGEFTDEQWMTSHWQVWRPLQMFVRGNVI
ncbi:hypothetical protein DER44DRAFT_200342 [Fusarium oxysporum]|nr:hypothetical protein DER44DRAFT_200342 [Fusarium oxysporum]